MSTHTLPHVVFYKCQRDAVIPTKSSPTSIGYDLTCIYKKDWNGDEFTFDTFIKASVSPGYYLEVVPEIQEYLIFKLADSIGNGIITPGYTGNIIITCYLKGRPAPITPFRCCKLVVRKYEESTSSVVTNIKDF